MELALIVVTLGSFAASFVNAAFATGGVYILLAASTAVLPLTAAIPLQSAFAFSSLLSRCAYFWNHIKWSIVAAFSVGSVIGVFLGAKIFVSLAEHTIAWLLGSLLLVFIWFPEVKWRLPIKHPFLYIGGLHSFLATMFGVGALLQPAILRTKLLKLQITSTLAACLITMDVFKMTGYISYGFDYSEYIPHIILATIAGFIGTWLGKRITHKISEETFRLGFKLLITLVALRLLYQAYILG